MRQKQKNNFSLRLRVVGGNLTAKQLAKIAEVAEKFGDGHVHLTSRQSVEIPFVKLDQIEVSALVSGSETAFFSLSGNDVRKIRRHDTPVCRRMLNLLVSLIFLIILHLLGLEQS